MDHLLDERREMARTLNAPGAKPDPSLRISRRTFLHKSLVTTGVTAGVATYGWWPLMNLVDLAWGQTAFRFAWLSDTHLYPKTVNTRFVEKAVRAVTEIKAMSPPADFLIFGGDLAQLGDPVELDLGADILKDITIKKVFIPGEHDWYLDMGAKWDGLFGKSPWSFDHKGVRFVGLDTVSRAADFWTAKKMTAKERMGHMSVLDGTLGGAWAGVGLDQLQWLQSNLANWPKNRPVVVFSHNPLYEYYPPWNFWVRDWREVQEVLKPYSNVTNIHGHVHQVLYNEIGTMRSMGMLATSWPWPYAPEGVPALTKCHLRADPGDHFDGVGWSQLTMSAANKMEAEYMMWRKKDHIVADTPWDSGCGDNANQPLSPRIADREWTYPGGHK
jgi:3',5'-cyclic-AMP phosphodiesterase